METQFTNTEEATMVFDILKDNTAKKVINEFTKAGYTVTKSGDFSDNDNFVWTEADYVNEQNIVIGLNSDFGITETKIETKEDLLKNLTSKSGTTNFYSVQFEKEEKIGYAIFKVKNGWAGNGKEYNNKVTLAEVGCVSKKSYEVFGEYNVYNQKEWNSMVKMANFYNNPYMYSIN